MKVLFFVIVQFFINAANAKPLMQVPIHFVEALSPKDTTSSERFQKDYELAINLGKTTTQKALSACGYEIQTHTKFFDSNDPIQATEVAKVISSQNPWLILGPRRSNHYLLLVKGAEQTPTLSPLATAKEVSDLGSLHLTISPFNNELALAAAKESKTRIKEKNKTYISIVSEDCVTCQDFAAQFDSHAGKLGLKKLQEFKVSGEEPHPSKIISAIAEHTPSFILLPNYSKVSSHLISIIHSKFPKPFFVGGDGWGDANFGFIQNGKDVGAAKGLTVRGFPPVADALKKLTYFKSVNPESITQSGTGLGVLLMFESIQNILCKNKPKSNKEFASLFEKVGKKSFSSPWGVSVYNLNQGQITFSRIRR